MGTAAEKNIYEELVYAAVIRNFFELFPKIDKNMDKIIPIIVYPCIRMFYMIVYGQRVDFVETVIENEDLLENYLGLLNGLSRESKIKLVESLSFDIKNNIVSKNDWIDKLYGSFMSDKPAETMISDIRSGRRFSREILGL
jgi:hypothetical protein